ncbi:hypothetical protein [Agrobacterium sp. LMR679]|uniref:hypothetical protein n=1 Tax=Agrobacterium sp. LMR679 TaxID=3014335 RepID=UPI0022AF416A|nr:hypothetical protein [Agrobacterium sp. LMR679]MCZ4076234.1 hypothetical protein [Agrobacterium sp. LMR679]
MIQLPNVTDLPASRSAGPESWGEAWSKAAGATDETMRLIENTNADYYGLEKAYDERIKLIADITGQTLPNPMREAAAVDLDPDRADVMAMSLGVAARRFPPSMRKVGPRVRKSSTPRRFRSPASIVRSLSRFCLRVSRKRTTR